MGFIDLHVHSDYSDGTFTPSQLVSLAVSKNLSAIALTDHDTIDGIWEAQQAAAKTSLELISGAELSCTYLNQEIHMLGLFLDPNSLILQKGLSRLREARDIRNQEIIRRFTRDGFIFSMEDLTQGSSHTVITRAHFARVLVEKGYVSSVGQAFKRYLDYGKKYCPEKENFLPEEAISLILSAGGFPAIAHPVLYRLGWKNTEKMIADFKELGLKGIEVYYSSHRINESLRLRELCHKYALLPTGGSDFHGTNKPDISLGTGMGGLRVSDLLLKDIKAAI